MPLLNYVYNESSELICCYALLGRVKGDNLGSECDDMPMNTNTDAKKTRHPKWVILLLTGAMLLSSISSYAGLAAASPTSEVIEQPSQAAVVPGLKKISEEIITSGARLIHYQYTTINNGKTAQTNLNVIEADLKNPYLKLDTMTGVSGQLNTFQSVKGMTNDTGAIAGVNGDYYNTGLEGAPLGGAITSGEMISSPSELMGMYAFAITKDGVPTIDEYRFNGTASGGGQAPFPLSGMNKATYTTEPTKQFSHVNSMYIYTSAWKNKERPKNSSTTPTEVLVQDGIVTDFADGYALDMAVPKGAYILRGHGVAAKYMKEYMQVGMPVDVDYELISQSSGQSIDPDTFQMMIGGHTLLVDNGQASTFTRDVNSISPNSARARTAVGYSQDNRYAYIVTAEKNENSSGLSLKDMQQAMVAIGAWKATNLDGGGSTQMVHRPLGDNSTTVTHHTETGTTQRRVVNGLGLFSTAPVGELKGMLLSGPNRLYIGQKVNYNIKAYDQYYNPVDASGIQVQWSAADATLAWDGSSYTAKKAGKTQVIAESGQATNTKDVEVIGAEQIQELYIDTVAAPLAVGTSIHVPVKVQLKDGSVGTLPQESVKWEFTGFKGNVTDGVLHVEAVPEGTKIGYAFAIYDGIKTMIPLTNSAEQVLDNFNASTLKPSFAGLPKDVTFGEVGIVDHYDGRSDADKVLRLKYDMTGGNVNKYAYALLNGETGLKLPAGTTTIKLDAYGDSSMNWMRMEFVDSKGEKQYADIAKVVDWTGWKSFEVDLSAISATGPLTLKKLYVVNLADGQDERSASGEVAFDNLKAVLPASGTAVFPQAEMKLTVNSKKAIVNKKETKLDVAPIVLNGTTYVPVRVILDAFGGSATWDNKAKRVSVLRGDSYLELRVDQKAYWNNGKLEASEVTPIIRGGRTLVPLRLVSQQLGLKVDWDQKSKTITLR